MKKGIIITWLVALVIPAMAFAQGRGYDDHQTVMNAVAKSWTNASVTTVPTLIGPMDGASVRFVINAGTSAVKVLMSNEVPTFDTNGVPYMNTTITNLFASNFCILTLGPNSTNVFKRGGNYELWNGWLYGISTQATNSVFYFGLKP